MPKGTPNHPKNRCVSPAVRKKKRILRQAIVELGVQVPGETNIELRSISYPDLCRIAVENGLDPKALTSDKEAVRCEAMAIKGGSVCYSHGGASPNVLKAARRRLGELIDPSINRISKIIRKSRHDPTAYKASKDILDSHGLGDLKESQDLTTYEYDESRLGLLSTEELQIFMKILRKLSGPKLPPGPVIDAEQANQFGTFETAMGPDLEKES